MAVLLPAQQESASSGVTTVQLAPIAGREEQIRRLFWETVTIGHPLPFELTCAKHYENLGLNLYLINGAADSTVALVDGEVVGYSLVCCDSESFHQVHRKYFVILVASVLLALITGRSNKESRRFYWLRLQDSLTISRTRKVLPKNVHMHAHLNVGHGFQDGSVSRKLRDHADRVCLSYGATAYFGEINAVGGRRILGLHRVGGQIVNDSTNKTFSWLTGQDVHRLTLIRHLAANEQQAA